MSLQNEIQFSASVRLLSASSLSITFRTSLFQSVLKHKAVPHVEQYTSETVRPNQRPWRPISRLNVSHSPKGIPTQKWNKIRPGDIFSKHASLPDLYLCHSRHWSAGVQSDGVQMFFHSCVCTLNLRGHL